MQKKLAFLIPVLVIALWSCTKTSTTAPVNPGSSSSIWPLKAGNSFIYQDTVFNADGSAAEFYTDSAYVNTQTTSRSGVTFYGFTDSLGWFGTGGFLAIDPANTAIYGLDSANEVSSPYLVFAIAPADGYLLASNQDFSNPNCIGFDASYGFTSTYNVAGYSCYKNIEYIRDCNGNITYTTVTYVSPGAGIVRVEEYSVVPGSTSNALYLDYSQTLQSLHLK